MAKASDGEQAREKGGDRAEERKSEGQRRRRENIASKHAEREHLSAEEKQCGGTDQSRRAESLVSVLARSHSRRLRRARYMRQMASVGGIEEIGCASRRRGRRAGVRAVVQRAADRAVAATRRHKLRATAARICPQAALQAGSVPVRIRWIGRKPSSTK